MGNPIIIIIPNSGISVGAVSRWLIQKAIVKRHAMLYRFSAYLILFVLVAGCKAVPPFEDKGYYFQWNFDHHRTKAVVRQAGEATYRVLNEQPPQHYYTKIAPYGLIISDTIAAHIREQGLAGQITLQPVTMLNHAYDTLPWPYYLLHAKKKIRKLKEEEDVFRFYTLPKKYDGYAFMEYTSKAGDYWLIIRYDVLYRNPDNAVTYSNRQFVIKGRHLFK